MRREPEASSSRRRLCPPAPYGLKVRASRMERQAVRAHGGLRERRELGGRRGRDEKFDRSRAVCPGPPRLRSGSPLTPSGLLRRGDRNLVAVIPSPSQRPGGNPRFRHQRTEPGQPPAQLRKRAPLSHSFSRRPPLGSFGRVLSSPYPSPDPRRAARDSGRHCGRRVVFSNFAFVRCETSVSKDRSQGWRTGWFWLYSPTF